MLRDLQGGTEITTNDPNQDERLPCWNLNRIFRNMEQKRKQIDQSKRHHIPEDCNINQKRENWTWIHCNKIVFIIYKTNICTHHVHGNTICTPICLVDTRHHKGV